MIACTIIAHNYRAYARVLATSFLRHHPDARFVTLVLDALPGDRAAGEPFEIVSPYEIGLESREVDRMAAIYDVKEMATAVKPALLRTLLVHGTVAYFDPDIEVFASLDEIPKLASEHAIVLTPHIRSPIPRDGLLPDDRMILQAGIYNLGFIAIGQGSEAFLDWWGQRLARDCVVDTANALFVDQRWVDFVPALFEHHVLRDPAYNVAYWNLHERSLHWTGDRYEVDGRPLRFFHFSGVDISKLTSASAHMGDRPRIYVRDDPTLERIFREYATKIRGAGFDARDGKPYRFDRLPNGVRLDPTMRRLFREALLAAETGAHEEPPDPFDPETASEFIAWLQHPDERHTQLPRYLSAVHAARADLQTAFPDPDATDYDAFIRWAYTAGREQGVSPSVLPELEAHARIAAQVERAGRRFARHLPGATWVVRGLRSRPSAARETERPFAVDVAEFPAPGVNVVGYFKAELGIAEVARKLVDAADSAGLPYSTITYGRTASRQAHPFRERAVGAHYVTNVICVNADQLPIFAEDVGPAFFSRRYSIGVWFWEIAQFPTRFHGALGLVDEVWVASDFVRNAIRRQTDKPVHVVPVPISASHVTPRERSELGLPDGFLFLFSFDFLSVAERKNPLGLVRAFSDAFHRGDGPVLVLKSINGDRFPEELGELRAATEGRADILIWDGYVDAETRDALTAACDCYVSLHRSEGYGLTLAESMAMGKPVIATAYSGNVDFMNPRNSYLVPYRLVPVPPGCDPYPTTAEWAEPDLAEASRLMRRVYEHQDEARELGLRARDEVLREFTVERTGDFLRQRVAAATDALAVARPDDEQPLASRAVNELSNLVSRGPVAGFQHRGRVGVSAARTLLQRLLWRQLGHQHEIDSAVRDALVELQREVAQLHEQTAAHLAGLTAAPYMSDPRLLRQQDASGRTVLAFSDGGGRSRELYREFEDIFRGPEEFISERQRPYVELVRGHEPVLDIGCGRGEFLDLLRAAGISADGVDIDEGMVQVSRGKGHDVALDEAISHLDGLEDASLGAVFAAQVIEHLQYEEFVRLLELTLAKLRPDGVLIAETVNPHALPAFKTFWVDLTHRSPIFPEVALAYAKLVGFRSGRIIFPDVDADFDDARLTSGEFALVATR